MNRGEESGKHPGREFTNNAYAAVCEKLENGDKVYHSFNKPEGLERYLSNNSVEGVRINSEEKPESQILQSYNPEFALNPYTEDVRAVVYGNLETVVFGEEEIRQ